MQTLLPPHLVEHLTASSVSLWMEEQIDSPPPLTQDLRADVCIVGGGIVGLTCAYFLTQRGLSVIVLEGGALCGGQTSRTTGHLTWALDDRYFDLESFFGVAGARLAAESHQEAIRQIEKIIYEEHIECDFEKLDAYLFLAPEHTLTLLDKEWATLQKIGMPVKKVARAPFDTFDTGPCLLFPDQRQFHILKYIKGIVKAIQRGKGKIFTHTHVERIQDGSPCQIETDRHHIITAQSTIVATNTPVNDRLMIHSKQAPYRTYVIAGSVPKDAVAKGLYYDTADPYHYIRLQKHESDPQSEWLLVGGEDHKMGQKEAENFERYEHLEQWTRQRFPMLRDISYRWSGEIFEPVDSLAFIGRNPHDENIFIATGDSGNGLTHGTLAGILLTDLITKGFHPWEKLYDPSRKTLRAVGEYAKENLNVASQYCDWLLPGDVDSVAKIPLGTGAVIRQGFKKIAVYRDEQGHAHCYSAVCPHLGCIIHWNPSEKCWDCPCHGSCFNIEGHVLNGPAIHNLTPVKEG